MSTRLFGAICFAVLWFVPAHAAIVTVEFSAPLTPLQEIPAPMLDGASPSGSAWTRVTFDDTNLAAGGLLSAVLQWSGLTSNATMGHIHRINNPSNCRADNTSQCGTGPVLIGLFNESRATTDTVTVTNLSITGGQMTALYAGLQLDPPAAGALYFNVHTVMNPPGEIRGDITDSQVIPEPGTYALLGFGLAAVWLRRRKSAA